MRRRFVAGNWKMYGTRAVADELASGLAPGCDKSVDVVVCPPFVWLDKVRGRLAGSSLALGAQDVCEFPGEGAYTGEVSASMLVDVGCEYVIIGHSERRAYFGDTHERVAAKVAAAQDAGLIPILCVGETGAQREAGETEAVLASQVDAVREHCGIGAFARTILAYEPVWAIGTGKTATPPQVAAVHGFLRAHIGREDDTLASELRIVYGGSVKPGNASELFGCEDVDGGLIGGASLHVDQFLAICHAAVRPGS